MATLAGPRWSSAVVCSRRAVYEGLGLPREPYSPELLAIFRRGRFIGEAIARDLSASLAEQGRPVGQPEREVPWPARDPIGVGHADYYVPDEAKIVEVVSAANGDLPAHKPLQAAGYALNDPEAQAAVVLVVEPSSFREQAHPVDLDGLADAVAAIEEAVLRGVRDGVLPERPAHVEHPGMRPCFDCPYRRECWKTWEPFPVGQLPERLHEELVELAELEDEISRSKKIAHLEERRAEIRETLKGLMIEGGVYRGGGITVKWTAVAPRRVFRLADFEKTGHELPPDAAEFVSESGGYDRWTVKRKEP